MTRYRFDGTGDEGDRRSSLIKTLLKILAAYLILSLDIFGLSTATDTASREAFRKFWGATYPTDERQQIAVVTLRDDDLPLFSDSTSNYWPISYVDMARLLTALAGTAPRAIFLDFYIPTLNPRDPGAGMLTHAIADTVRTHNIPVFLADHYRLPRPEQPDGHRFSGPAETLVKAGARPVMAAWRAEDYEYPLFVERESGAPALAKTADGTEASAAEALFELVRPGVRISGPPMTVIWGSQTADSYSAPDRHALKCLAGTGGWRLHLRLLFQAFLGPKSFSSAWYQPNPCFFHDDYSARQFLNAYNSGRAYDAFKNRIIILDANMAGESDVRISPIHGPVPGGHLHAMALDNLLTGGNAYLRDPQYSPLSIWSLDLASLIEITIITLTILLADNVSETDLYRRQPWPAKGLYMSLVFIFFLVALGGVALLMLRWGHYVPINWTALSSVCLLAVLPGFDALATACVGGGTGLVRALGRTWNRHP